MYERRTVPELKALLRERQLSVEGLKSELADRLVRDDCLRREDGTSSGSYLGKEVARPTPARRRPARAGTRRVQRSGGGPRGRRSPGFSGVDLLATTNQTDDGAPVGVPIHYADEELRLRHIEVGQAVAF